MKWLAVVAALALGGCSSHENICADITKAMVDKNIMAFSSYGDLEDPRIFMTFFQNEVGIVEFAGGRKDATGHCDGIAEVQYVTKDGEQRSVTLSVVLDYDEIGENVIWKNTEISLL